MSRNDEEKLRGIIAAALAASRKMPKTESNRKKTALFAGQMGRIKTDKKAASSRINGILGGRPTGSKNKPTEVKNAIPNSKNNNLDYRVNPVRCYVSQPAEDQQQGERSDQVISPVLPKGTVRWD
jgi:hypothetical protein